MIDRMGDFLFRYRGRLPVPFGIVLLILSDPSPLSFFVGALLILGGELLRIWSIGYSGARTRFRKMEAETLATSGPYAHLRNPIYLGNFIICLGFLISADSWMPWMFIPFLALFSFQYGFIVKAEESYLRGRFGEVYLSYCRAVPSWLPRLHPYPGALSTTFDVTGALRSELHTFQTIAGAYLFLLVRWAISLYFRV